MVVRIKVEQCWLYRKLKITATSTRLSKYFSRRVLHKHVGFGKGIHSSADEVSFSHSDKEQHKNGTW